jgi:hypothetical protein
VTLVAAHWLYHAGEIVTPASAEIAGVDHRAELLGERAPCGPVLSRAWERPFRVLVHGLDKASGNEGAVPWHLVGSLTLRRPSPTIVAMEGTDHEEKSVFEWTSKDKLEVVKNVVAMANTDGGSILLKSIQCDASYLDSARLDDLVNKHIEPKFHGIRSQVSEGGECVILVERSATRPHVFLTAQSYTDGRGRPKTVFYPGQVFVRHSSKTDPARGEDVQQILREATGEVVRQLGAAIQGFSGDIREVGIPVTLGAEGLFQVSMKNPNEVFPYTAKTLGKKLGKNQSWVARAVRKLGMITKPEFCWAITGASATPIA